MKISEPWSYIAKVIPNSVSRRMKQSAIILSNRHRNLWRFVSGVIAFMLMFTIPFHLKPRVSLVIVIEVYF